jgi:uncharacterized phage protein (TIGR02216 family)
MTAGLGLLRLTPAAFWAMSLKELDCALAALMPTRDGAPNRAALDALMARFPD